MGEISCGVLLAGTVEVVVGISLSFIRQTRKVAMVSVFLLAGISWSYIGQTRKVGMENEAVAVGSAETAGRAEDVSLSSIGQTTSTWCGWIWCGVRKCYNQIHEPGDGLGRDDI